MSVYQKSLKNSTQYNAHMIKLNVLKEDPGWQLSDA